MTQQDAHHAMFCSAMQPRSLKAPQRKKKPLALRARDRPLEKVQMLHKQTGMSLYKYYPSTTLLSHTNNQSQPSSPSCLPLCFSSLCLSCSLSFQSRTHHRHRCHLQLRPSLTLAALDRDALALHRAASSCCIASDAYPGTAEIHKKAQPCLDSLGLNASILES